jgi:4-hydroxybenzoate decarboxylase
VLFEQVGGSAMRVVSSLYGSHANLLRALDRADGCLPGLAGRGRAGTGDAGGRGGFVGGSLADLPAITWHARDGAPYFTSAIYLAREPDSGVPNLSFHRSMQVSDGEFRVRLDSTHDLARYQAKAEARGEPLEAALLLSCPTEIFLAACAPWPDEASELVMVAKIRG